jgi:hypothetical protein
MQVENKNLLYIYDLPKSIITSVILKDTVKKVSQYDISEAPQIRRNPDRPFYTAIIKINDERFKEISHKLRHFNIECGDVKFPVRALPFDRELTGANRANIQNKNVFLKSINKDLTAGQLE